MRAIILIGGMFVLSLIVLAAWMFPLMPQGAEDLDTAREDERASGLVITDVRDDPIVPEGEIVRGVAQEAIFEILPPFFITEVELDIYCLPDTLDFDETYRSSISFGDGREVLIEWGSFLDRGAPGVTYLTTGPIRHEYSEEGTYIVSCRIEHMASDSIIADLSREIVVTAPGFR